MRDYLPYFQAKAADVYMIDVPWNGFSQAKKIGDLAESFQLNIAPHNYYSHLATFIGASLCAVLPNVHIMEIDVDDVPWKGRPGDEPAGDRVGGNEDAGRPRVGHRARLGRSAAAPLDRQVLLVEAGGGCRLQRGRFGQPTGKPNQDVDAAIRWGAGIRLAGRPAFTRA